MAVVETLPVFTVAALHLAVMPWRIWRKPRRATAVSNRVGKCFFEGEKRLVDSKPLSVWTHST